jgi:hypothetical protein
MDSSTTQAMATATPLHGDGRGGGSTIMQTEYMNIENKRET